MVDQEIVRSKVTRIQYHLQRVQTRQPLSATQLQASEDLRDIVLHNLQHAIQGSLDLASHLVADARWEIPATQAELFQRLSDHRVLSLDLATRMKKMVGFRNLIVHEYIKIKLEMVIEVLNQSTKDLDQFCREVIRYAGI